jgi:NAD(P)-dependent dehydrogenase (short-subunit alcohol dehydrogenase family)
MTDSIEGAALVSGAVGNVGSALARLLAARGARLALLDRMEAPLRAVLEADAGHLLISNADLLDPKGCEAAVAQVIARFGRLDMVAHTVGAFSYAPFVEGVAEAWEAMFRINLISTVNLYRAALPAMRSAGRGSLVAIGAQAALNAPAGVAAYAASKAGVLRLTESLAAELKDAGIRVNAVLPGTIDTPQNRAAMPDADPGRWVQPTQVAEAMAFLLSDAASGVTGALLPVSARG